MTSPRFVRACLAAALVSTVLLPVSAGDAATQSLDEGAVRLTLNKIPDIEHGTAAILQGETGTAGDKFFLEYLNITQPVTVVLMSANPRQQPLTLNLVYFSFMQDRYRR